MHKYFALKKRNHKPARRTSGKIEIEKKGQIAIWVIIGIVLVSAILLFFVLEREPRITMPPEEETVFNIRSFLESCTHEYVEDTVDKLLPQGGFAYPRSYVLFNNTNITYLCVNRGFYEPCVQQHPMLLNEIKQEIKREITPKVQECFESMREEFEDRQGVLTFGDGAPPEVKIDLAPDRILVNIKKEASVNFRGETRLFDNFDIEIQSPLHNLASVAMEISAQEGLYCYFEYTGYSVIYPRYKIKKFVNSQSIKIYSIEDTRSGKKMNVAFRSCAIPPGY